MRKMEKRRTTRSQRAAYAPSVSSTCIIGSCCTTAICSDQSTNTPPHNRWRPHRSIGLIAPHPLLTEVSDTTGQESHRRTYLGWVSLCISMGYRGPQIEYLRPITGKMRVLNCATSVLSRLSEQQSSRHAPQTPRFSILYP